MPKVSIIVPVYNAEKYLSATLESALQQSFTDLEIICIDDGSTDGSAAILKQFQERDARVKVSNQKNSGGSAARNAGLQYATGDYVMFLDSDDLYAKDIVAQAYDRASATGADIVFYNFARFVRKPTKLAVVNRNSPKGDKGPFTKESYAQRFFNDFAIITWNKLVKKSIIADNNLAFNTELSHNHDVDFSIRLMLSANTYYWLDEVGYYYRANSTGLTATKRSDPTNVLKIFLNLNKEIVAKYEIVKPSFNDYVADMIAGTIMKYRGNEQKVTEIAKFAHDSVIPKLGLNGCTEPTGIFELVEAGEYGEVVIHTNNLKLKTRAKMRSLYDVAQDVLARFTV